MGKTWKNRENVEKHKKTGGIRGKHSKTRKNKKSQGKHRKTWENREKR